ncbi:hypothetical protein AB4Y45_23095 [Paraburkholderia sp. EG287A]|uniref:hypothetical protein n=1 Tax=Paraburkholderia sp. EG287A TaxID=3237012 RepID=UPI0034D332CB
MSTPPKEPIRVGETELTAPDSKSALVAQLGNLRSVERERRGIPEGVMYCKLEALDARSDYRGDTQCTRLFGISRQQFDESRHTDRPDAMFDVFLLDIENSLWRKRASREMSDRQARARFYDERKDWLEVTYRITNRDYGQAYAYPLFVGSAPTFIDILGINPVRGKAIRPSQTPSTTTPHHPSASSQYSLEGFHVGQGMCSVFHNGTSGFLLDAGAGIPVLRKDYDQPKFVNELLPLVKSLSPLSMVLSHFDADHWRLLDWDEDLLACVNTIYVPNNFASLPFKSKVIGGKVVPIGTQLLLNDLSAKASLQVIRSRPRTSDKNGECLVAICTTSGKHALLPGDYTYTRMSTDSAAGMKSLTHMQYEAIVVPHHGDAASAHNVAQPASKASIAFFSAGTHGYYNHPTPQSLAEHTKKGFVVVNKHKTAHIKLQNLLP